MLRLVPKKLSSSETQQPITLNVNTKDKSTQLNVNTTSKSETLNVNAKDKVETCDMKENQLSTKISLNRKPAENQLSTKISLNRKPAENVVTGAVGTVYPTADAYKKYDHRTHVYMKPDTYIGADERMTREEWIFDMSNRQMINATIDFTPGCERLFLEILTNASDNVGRSRRAGVDPGNIEIAMNNKTISVTNYGLPIPVEIHPEENVYVPEMIFGSLLTSSNYEVDRHEAGTNGIGAKATNIFSTEFMVIVQDHIRHVKYSQVWNNNMTQRGEPEIQEYKGKTSSVQIVYSMDFARFKYPVPNGDQGGYTPEAFALFARHAIDISFTAKTTVIFNGNEYNFANIRDYARLYFGDAVNSAIVHYQWPAGTEVIKKKKGYQVAKNMAITPDIELIAIDTPDEGHHVSFVNCMMTRDGGVHVNSAVKAVGDSAVQRINDTMLKKLLKQNKGKELDAKEKRNHTININDVKPHISILLAVKVVNPKFTSQTKTMLHSPSPKIDIPDEELRAIDKWQLIDRLYAALDAKQFASLAKTDGKLKRYVRLQKGIDANDAGKANRLQCVLYITEGRSGAGYANKLVGLVPGGRDRIGVLPMRGKSLNVMNADRFQIEKNNEINELKKMLGLVDCPDPRLKETYYLDDTNFNKLRYGAIMIMADSDVDGKHIIGLILNFFYCRFPSLLYRGYVMYYRTPTLRVSFGRGAPLKFYTQQEYDNWKNSTPNYMNWKHKYYKGLGTSKDEEIRDDFNTPRVVTCLYDENASEAMKLAFDKKMSDQRKDWIGCWRPVLGVEDVQMQPISWFINHELILFSIADIQRSIPKLTDGLKESHRKILHGAHLRWKIGSKSKQYQECKVAQFGAFVADKSNYHHGELILGDVIVGMAQNFVGSNNISWFCRDGQFGCVDPNTPILTWDGSTKLAKDITMKDVLIGDDGNPRHISKIVSGIDDMYEIVQKYGENYKVNSQHILTLYFPQHKSICWSDAGNLWKIIYYDTTLNVVKSKEFSVTSDRTKEDAKQLMLNFATTIPDDNIFDINLQTYLSFSPSRKKLFRSVHNHVPIKWTKQEVPIDPYIFGMWLGDGRSNGQGVTSADCELIKEWVIWLSKINVEVVHHKSGKKGFHYGFRKKGYKGGNSLPIGHKNHSSKICEACIGSSNLHPACDWVYSDNDYDEYFPTTGNSDLNNFVSILKDHNLLNNKHIPEIYIINDEETRLNLLAGLIDTDGTLFCDKVYERFEISQEINSHGHIIDSAEYIAKSLGFRTSVSISKRKDSTLKRLSISGDIKRIPTRLPRKQSDRCVPFIGTGLEVKYAGRGEYVGWYIDGNERFLFGDFTVGHNTRYASGKDAAETRYSFTRPEKLVSYILRKEDRPILKHIVDEGEAVEPETYYPVIPMILVNGGEGIGTGWSSFIPCHNPLDIIKWLRMKLNGTDDKDLPLVLPWYRGFKGVIKVIDRTNRRKRNTSTFNVTLINYNNDDSQTPEVTNLEVDDTNSTNHDDKISHSLNEPAKVTYDENENENYDDYDDYDGKEVYGSRPLLSMVTMGKFHRDFNGTIIITELPIGRCAQNYHKWLEELVENKVITGFRDCSVDNSIYFEIYGFTDTPNHRNLRLQRTIGMSNMVLLDENNRPVRYDTSFDILEAFYSRRLPVYQRRKEYILQNISKEISTMNHKIRYIQAVIDKQIRFINRNKASVYAVMDQLGIPHEIFDNAKQSHLTLEDIALLRDQIASKESELSLIHSTSPEQMWLRDLEELETVYRDVYNIPKPTLVLKLPGYNNSSQKDIPAKSNKRSSDMPAMSIPSVVLNI